MMDEEKRKKRGANAAIANASNETVQRFGSAVKEHFVAYGGVDNETGEQLKRSLKSIAGSKVNPDDVQRNINQQAGFSAELKKTARDNAENIIGNKSTRTIRSDDLGRVNDPLYDHFQVDGNGNVIFGSGSQMKFVGGGPEDCLDKIMSLKYQKYFDNDVIIDVPADYYPKMVAEADRRIAELNTQLKRLQGSGKTEQAQKVQDKIQKYERLKSKNLRDSGIKKKDAVFARLHPELSTAVDIANLSHRAGVESAKISGAVGGGMSAIHNAVALAKGEKELGEATLGVVTDTGKAAVLGYGTTFAGTALKGAMQNSSAHYLRALSKSGLPANVVAVALETGKSLQRLLSGQISGSECLAELGQSGTGMLSSAMFASAFQMVIPIPVVGALIGSMVGYAFSNMFYGQLMSAIEDAKYAREERIRIEAECAEAVKAIRAYRAEMERIINAYLAEYAAEFSASLTQMDEAYRRGDADGVIEGANRIRRKLGGATQFETVDEFGALMASPLPFKL